MTILKTRFIRENYPDIVGIGGDINYSNFLDAELFMDISDLDVTAEVKPAYAEMSVRSLSDLPHRAQAQTLLLFFWQSFFLTYFPLPSCIIFGTFIDIFILKRAR